MYLQIQHLLNPVQGPRDAQTRQGIKPMDHARSNAHAVREASQLNALRKAAAEAQQKVKAPGKKKRSRNLGCIQDSPPCAL